MPYQLTSRLTAFLVEHEGELLVACREANGTWIIGGGHTGKEVLKGYTITLTESRRLLVTDVTQASASVVS